MEEINNPKQAQDRLLLEILKLYNSSQASAHKKINSYKEFLELPIKEYADIEEDLLAGRLFPKKVRKFEKTSGSSGKNKYIPYSKELLKSFQKLFFIWAIDILKNIEFKKLTFYFSISPQFKSIDKNSEKYETFESDKDYLGTTLSLLGAPFFVEIPRIKNITDPNDFKMILSLYLISRRDLEIISIWSPSFLLELRNFINNNESKILKLLERGSFTNSEGKVWRFKKVLLEDLSINSCFPSLRYISSWGSVNAKKQFHEIEAIFPKATIQKKGLLATEAPMTLPIFEANGFVPLLTEVFFEFISSDNQTLRLHELEVDEIYEVIITQKSGLYRYRMKDQIIVTHIYKNTPCFDFYGRRDALSDLVGEKLHERDVQEAFEETNALTAIPSEKQKKYLIFSELELSLNEKEKISTRLSKNYHYNNSLKLGQLKELDFIVISDCEAKISSFFETVRMIKKGDQKLSQLLYREVNEELVKYLLRS